MPGLRSKILDNWAVAAFAVAMIAVAIGSVVLSPDFSWSMPSRAYPIRIELPEPRQARQAGLGKPAQLIPEVQAPSQEPNALSPTGSAGVSLTGAPADPSLRPSAQASGPGAGVPAAKRVQGLLPLTFDLSDPHGAAPAAGGSAIAIRKAVRLNGADAGTATIHVTSDSRLLISRDEVRQLVARAGLKSLADQIGGGGLMSFDEIRNAGIVVRYDPVSDRILIST